MKPKCYNHPEHLDSTKSLEFRITIPNQNSKTCGHWLPLGNAYVRPFGDDVGGNTFDWKECEGCKWKT